MIYKLYHNIFDIILNNLDPLECIKLTLISKKIIENLNECKYYKNKNKEFSGNHFHSFTDKDNISLYRNNFNSYCYICKTPNLIKSAKYCVNGYNLCFICKSKCIHYKSMNYNFNNNECIKYPFYNFNIYQSNIREDRFIKMINQINQRKSELETAFSNKQMLYPQDSVLCKNYILNRTNTKLSKIVEIICHKKYLYEYTSYKSLKKYFYYQKNLSWNNAHKASIKMVLNNNKYPEIYPWEN